MSSSNDIEIYKAFLEDVGRIGARHETARGFYLSVLSALLAFLALAGSDGALGTVRASFVVIIGIGGMAISALWLLHTLSFTALYSTKFKKLVAMEANFDTKPFTEELATLASDRRYIRVTYVECAVAVVFSLLFVAMIAI